MTNPLILLNWCPISCYLHYRWLDVKALVTDTLRASASWMMVSLRLTCWQCNSTCNMKTRRLQERSLPKFGSSHFNWWQFSQNRFYPSQLNLDYFDPCQFSSDRFCLWQFRQDSLVRLSIVWVSLLWDCLLKQFFPD